MGKVMVRLIVLIFALVLWSLPANAATWSDSGMDMGIGVLGLKPGPAETKTVVKGLYKREKSYSEALRKALSGIELRRQPYETHPVVGRFEFSEDGILGIQTPHEFFSLIESGIPIQEGTRLLIVKKRQGNWVEVVISNSPVTSGWVKLTKERPLAFWLWYHYMDSLVKANKPLFFITPLHDDILYQPNPNALSALKNVFQLEDAVLYPEKLEGAYMLIRMGQPLGCKQTPRLEDVQPLRAWIRWIEDNGRPRVFEYDPPTCP